jgi:hypothetical protein
MNLGLPDLGVDYDAGEAEGKSRLVRGALGGFLTTA